MINAQDKVYKVKSPEWMIQNIIFRLKYIEYNSYSTIHKVQ